jgi:DNA-binding MarR family transcriptional regulator
MPKLARPRAGVPTTTAAVNMLRQNYVHLGLDPGETRLVHHILFRGKKARWSLMKGRNFANETAHLIGVHPSTFKEKVATLVERGWLRKGTNDDGQAYVQLTTAFSEACERADQRREVRFIILHHEWQKHNGDDHLADLVHELALEMMPQKNYKEAVKAAWYEVAIRRPAAESRGRHPATSGVATRRPEKSPPGDLKLIRGERKSGT